MSLRGAPKRIILSASNTASTGRVCAGDGNVVSACRLGDAAAFAINQRLSVAITSIAQAGASVLCLLDPNQAQAYRPCPYPPLIAGTIETSAPAGIAVASPPV